MSHSKLKGSPVDTFTINMLKRRLKYDFKHGSIQFWTYCPCCPCEAFNWDSSSEQVLKHGCENGYFIVMKLWGENLCIHCPSCGRTILLEDKKAFLSRYVITNAGVVENLNETGDWDEAWYFIDECEKEQNQEEAA